jgi:transposase
MYVVPKTPPPIDITALLRNGFSNETARELYAQGEEVAVFVMLQLAILAAQVASVNGQHPSAPSGSIATYQKEPSKQKGKKPGAKPGHKGSHRPPPDKITHHIEHIAKCCPDCGGKLNRRKSTRKRIVEDIPKDITPEVTEHTIHLDYCPKCKKVVEPVVPDAMPGAQIGHRVVVLSAFLHYLIGTTIAKIVEIFGMQFWFKLTPGGLVQLWHRLALTLKPWYDEIGEMVKACGVLHADETGWRVNGKTYWLWVFTTQTATYYLIDQSRASRVVLEFFKKAFAGILVTDFFGAYNAIVCTCKQKCLVHLLGDMKKVEKYKDKNADWRAFSNRLKRLLRDAMRLCGQRSSLDKATYERRCARVENRLTELLALS